MTEHAAFKIGDWQVWPDRNAIMSGEATKTLEPKVMELLLLLVDANGNVLSRADIEEEIWGQIIVGEDTVARLVSKLRKAFDDTAQAPKYIETISKKGYRFMQSATELPAPDLAQPRPKKPAVLGWLSGIAIIGLALFLLVLWAKPEPQIFNSPELARADDLYMNFTYGDNETAIKLYEQVLAKDSDNARAQSGLANALVQRVIRWPDGKQNSETGTDSLSNALSLNLHQTDFGQMTLERATGLAERSARLSPKDADALKALGLTYAAQGRLNDAQIIYEKAIVLDPMAWESMVNLGEIHLMKNETNPALNIFIRAYEVMDKSYATEPQKIGQWQSQLGTTIARIYLQQANLGDAEIWYRRVLTIAPLDKDATIGLAAILRVNGDRVQADTICGELRSRLNDIDSC